MKNVAVIIALVAVSVAGAYAFRNSCPNAPAGIQDNTCFGYACKGATKTADYVDGLIGKFVNKAENIKKRNGGK